MAVSIPKDQIKGYECRHVVYCPPNKEYGTGDDYHFIKEKIHLNDGTSVPNVRGVRNWKRPFWVEKKGTQNYKQKKEWTNVDTLLEYKCTQAELVNQIARALGTPWVSRKSLREICRSPYVYGADILSTALLKKSYQEKFPDLISPYDVAVYDIETNVLDGTNQIMMATVAYRNRVFTAVQKSFFNGQTNVMDRLFKALHKYIGEYVEKRKIEWVVELVDDEIGVVKNCFQRVHEWKPDFLAIWNIDFDLPKTVAAIENAGMNPAEIFSDPSVPEEFRYFKYKRGPNQKVTASGLVTPIKPAAQWHTAYCPASFYFIDAMCAFRHIRTGNQEEPSYALDSILSKILGIRKLKFEEADGLEGLDWHMFMQEKYPFEYVIYNVFDCVSMEELDEKTMDLRMSLPQMSGCSDYENFKSQPRRLADNLHFFAIEKGKRIGTTSDQMADEFDQKTIGLDGWIVTLPAELVLDNGLKIIQENPDLRTNLRVGVADLDVSASYPNGGSVFNISRETTHRELCYIQGVSEYKRRMAGINLSAGQTNAIEVCCDLFGLPTLDKLLDSFQQELEMA